MIAGIVGGLSAVLSATLVVGWTLRSERRRSDAEAKALKAAVGAEIRVAGAAALNAFQRVYTPYANGVPYTVAQLGLDVVFPPFLIATNSGYRLGALGLITQEIVHFVGSVESQQAIVTRFSGPQPAGTNLSMGNDDRKTVITSLLRLAEFARSMMAKLPGATTSTQDARFAEAVLRARRDLDTGRAPPTAGVDKQKPFNWNTMDDRSKS
jgi:hypothetical protein